MSGIPRSIRSAVLSLSPGLGHMYRLLRDKRAAMSDAVPLPFGFTLAGDKSLTDGGYEKEEIAVFLEMLEKASVCLDIGANVGLYTCLAASRGKHVIAVEPVARNLGLLYRNLLANSFTDVEVFPIGLSNRSGIKPIYGTGGSASFRKGWAGAPSKNYQAVPVSTLDLIAGRIPEQGQVLIKMDVEGHELEVLTGAVRMLDMDPRPTWLIEICLNQGCVADGVNERFGETFEVFWKRGYQAKVPDSSQRRIEPEDVRRWAREGAVDFGSSNYLFC